MRVAYHMTAAKNVGAIIRHGLIPRDTSRYNYPGAIKNAGDERIYLWTDWEGVLAWRYGYEEQVIVMVDVTGLRLEKDPYYDAADMHRSARRYSKRVPPECIIGVVRPTKYHSNYMELHGISHQNWNRESA